MKAINKLELSTVEEPKDSIMNLLEKKFQEEVLDHGLW